MSESLSEQLNSLHQCISELNSTNEEKARLLVNDISKLCLNGQNYQQLAIRSSLLFHETTGLLSFLQKTILLNVFTDVKVAILEFLDGFINNLDKKLTTYAVELKKVCLNLFNRDQSAKVQAATLPVLVQIFERCNDSSLTVELDVSKCASTFLTRVMQSNLKSVSVKQGLYHVLGILAKSYPDIIRPLSAKLLHLYLSVLRMQMTSKSKKVEFAVVAGCIAGLDGLLFNFKSLIKDDEKKCEDSYQFVKNSIKRNLQLSRYDMPKAGLLLFSHHSSLYGNFLYRDYEEIYQHLYHFTEHTNRELRFAGFSALDAFFEQIAERLVFHASSKAEGSATVFKYFIREFQKIINSSSQVSKLRIAVKGYGLFAAPCKIFLSEEDVKFMFNEMISRSEQVFIGKSELMEDKIQSLPSFLEALSSIITHLDNVTESFLMSLQKLVVLMIENYPLISSSYNHFCVVSVLLILASLLRKGSLFKSFLNQIIYEGLIRTCSHLITSEVDEEENEKSQEGDTIYISLQSNKDPRRITYKDYMTFWQTMLNGISYKELNSVGLSIADRQYVTENIYDEIISCALGILKKLDLSSVKIHQEEKKEPDDQKEIDDNECDVHTDPIYDLTASKPMDFQIFVNLVDFIKDLLPKIHHDLFNKWVYTYVYQVIEMSSRHYLVSGFYKLLTTSLKICAKNHYFEDFQSNSEHDEDDMITDSDNIDEKHAVSTLLTKFSKEVIMRLKQYKDDLLSSCIQFVLTLPAQIARVQMEIITPVLKIAFKIGQSYLPLVVVGLEALEMWHQKLTAELLVPCFREVFPCLDNFLTISSTGFYDKEMQSDTIFISRKTSNNKGRKKLPIKVMSKKKKIFDTKEQVSLYKVRMRILKLLGKIGSENNASMSATEPEELASIAVAWDCNKHLPFSVPFVDVKPVIYLDIFLPRVTELALRSTDRQVKVAACELLHAMVVYLIGSSFSKSQDLQKPGTSGSPAKLYSKILPVLFQLACDVDQVMRQLFEPLVFQIIHWFTSKFKRDDVEPHILLTALLDGLAHPTDTAMRDFCARCIREFLVWSIKQSKLNKSNTAQIKKLIRRICNLSVHPNPLKRLSASLAFNSMYKVFREQEELVNIHIFGILVSFVDGLSLAHLDDKSFGTEENFKQCLDHVEKIVRVKAVLLSKKDDNREIPIHMKDSTLESCVEWLALQCGRPHTECRHKCMELVCKLSPHIPGMITVQKYFQNLVKKNGIKFFLTCFEGGCYENEDVGGIANITTLSDVKDNFSIPTCVNWFEMLLASLDCCTWSFSQQLLPVKPLLKGSKVFYSLEFFVTRLSSADINEAGRCFETSSDDMIFTPNEVGRYNQAKCTAIVRIMDFVVVMISTNPSEFSTIFPVDFWSESFFEMIIKSVLNPGDLGFDMTDVTILTNLPEKTEQLLEVLLNNLSEASLNLLMKVFTRSLNGCNDRTYDLMKLLPVDFRHNGHDLLFLKQLIGGYLQLHRCGYLDRKLQNFINFDELTCCLLNTVIDNVANTIDGRRIQAEISPLAKDVLVNIFSLMTSLGVQVTKVIDLLVDDRQVLLANGQSTVTLGQLTMITLKDCIVGYANRHCDEFIPEIMRRSRGHSVMSILIAILDSTGKNKELRHRYGSKMADSILTYWKSLESCVDDEFTSLLTLLSRLLIISSKFLTTPSCLSVRPVVNMYCKFLERKAPVTFTSNVLDILPFFCDLEEDNLVSIRQSLDIFIQREFMLSKTSGIGSDDPRSQHSRLLFVKLLSAMEISGSTMLLDAIIGVICSEQNHAWDDEAHDSLVKYIKRIPRSKQKDTIDIPYEIFTSESSISDVFRRCVLEKVCLVFLQATAIPGFKQFFSNHIKEIVRNLTSPTMISTSTQMKLRIGSCNLIEVLYSRLGKDDLSSQMNRCYCDNAKTGKELTSEVSNVLHKIKKESYIERDLNMRELRRQYRCAAYNAFMAVIMRTQTELKFYTILLFTENPQKNDYLWDNIVDKSKNYSFPMELESPLLTKRKFATIRQQIRESRRHANDDISNESVHDLTSQYLNESSLSEVVGNYDFSEVQSLTGVSKSEDTAVSENQADNSYDADGMDYAELEMDELNQHECMSSLTTVLRYMDKKKIYVKQDNESDPLEMPSWMNKIHTKFTESSTHLNVKLFLVKLIINNREIFEPYAKDWIISMIELITSGNLGSYINYFVLDIVVTVLSWSSVAIPEDTPSARATATNLLEFLVSNCYYPVRAVYKNNLEIIKTLVECWKDRIDIPTRMIYDQMKTTDEGSKDNSVGIQLLGIVLANDLPAYRPSSVSEDAFYKMLAANLKFKHKEIYGATAEVIGLILNQMEAEKITDVDSFKEFVDKSLIEMTKDNNWSRFIVCVHNVHKHNKSFTLRFVNKLLFKLPKLHGEFRSKSLEVILGHVQAIPDVFQEMKCVNINSFLRHRDKDTQQMALMIIQKMLPLLSTEQLMYLLPSVTSNVKQPNVNCRKATFDILMATYEKYRFSSDEDRNAFTMCKENLLHGLNDSNMQIRLALYDFWTDKDRLSQVTTERLSDVLDVAYCSSSERHFLTYSTSLVMELTSKSPDYDRKIFPSPLSDCKFEDYKVQSGWKQRHSSMLTPLFVGTHSIGSESSLSVSNQASGDISSDSLNRLQATQVHGAQQFSETVIQDVGHRSRSGESSDDSLSSVGYSIGSLSESISSDSLSSMMFGATGKYRRKKTASKDDRNTCGTETETFQLLRRRFTKDREKTKYFYAKRELRMQKMREEMFKEGQQRRESQVTMYRSYRIGDLPDIEINYSAVIAPLQALAQKDKDVAGLLFNAVFSGIAVETKDKEKVDFYNRCHRNIGRILEETTQYDSSFMSVVLTMCVDDVQKFKFDADDVWDVAESSSQHHLGILYLEESISRMKCTKVISEPARKRSRTSAVVSVEPEIPSEYWIKMAELYKSIDNWDVPREIFSFKMKPYSKDLMMALDAEACRKYQQAVKLYENILTDVPESNDTNEFEIDMCHESLLRCCDALTKWDKLDVHSRNRLSEPTNIDEFWSNSYAQDHYLPFMIRSKLKMLIETRNDQTLLTFVDKAFEDSDRKVFLENRYPAELASLFIIQEDYDRARYYASSCLQIFLEEWSSTSKLTPSIRRLKLQGLQKITEMQDFLGFLENESNLSSEKPVNRLLDRWMASCPSIKDPVSVWDDIVSNRLLYMEKLDVQLKRNLPDDSASSSTLLKTFRDNKLKLEMKYVESMNNRLQYSIALDHLKKTKNIVHECNDADTKLKWTHLYCEARQQFCTNQQTGEAKIHTLLSSIQLLDRANTLSLLESHPPYYVEHFNLKSYAVEQIAWTLHRTRGELNVDNVIEYFGDGGRLKEMLIDKAFTYLKHGVESVEKNGGDADATAHLKLAEFCNKYLSSAQNQLDDPCPLSIDDYPKYLVSSLLTAMRYGSDRARLLFPRLLQIIESYDDTRDMFVSESASVPSWMFIGWTNQLMAILDKPEASAVHNIVTSIAEMYPQAIAYAYKLSSEGYNHDGKSKRGKKNKEFCKKLENILEKLVAVDEFILALSLLCPPKVVVKEWFTNTIDLIDSGAGAEKIKNRYGRMYDELFNPSERAAECYKNFNADTVITSNFRSKFKKNVEHVFVSKFGCRGEKVTKMKSKDLHVIYCNQVKPLLDKESLPAKRYQLGDMSSWLSNYRMIKRKQNLEIPGQYTGEVKPLPEYHVKIAGFGPSVEVMASVALPRSLVILGNDEREYKFLVKGGEDLRQDNRIEQLFRLMNKTFVSDSICRTMPDMKIHTYQVIPLTCSLGIIEWINDTLPLKNLIADSCVKMECDPLKKGNDALMGWINPTKAELNNQGKMYGKLYKSVDAASARKKFEELAKLAPVHLLRKAFVDMSASLEAFVTLRQQFAVTHAVLCICNWIVGIGDRHLANFLVCMKTGGIVGIDFGHAFGSATEELPVPELIPFRLTPQILNLMDPMKEHGLIRSTMVHALSAIANNHELLLNVMEVFVKEPKLDWQKRSNQKTKELVNGTDNVDGTGVNSIDRCRHPKEMIDRVRRKLTGVNPCYITREELKANKYIRKEFDLKKVLSVCMGDEDVNVRATLPRDGLTPEQQVSCLIDQATDPCILVRSYHGLSTWI